MTDFRCLLTRRPGALVNQGFQASGALQAILQDRRYASFEYDQGSGRGAGLLRPSRPLSGESVKRLILQEQAHRGTDLTVSHPMRSLPCMALDFTNLLPEGLTPYNFQTVGAGYAVVS